MTFSRVTPRPAHDRNAGNDTTMIPGPIAPELMRAVCIAHREAPFPFIAKGADHEDRLYRHCTAFEAVLRASAAQAMADIDADGQLWADHFVACQRLASWLRMGPPPYPLDAMPANVLYALARTPYVRNADGSLTLCATTFALKLRWFSGEGSKD